MKRAAVLIVVSLILVGFTCAIAFTADEATTTSQIKPKEIKIDRNGDGIVDRTEYYDSKGVITKVELYKNYDGKVDECITYENGVHVKGEKDINNDGKPDTTIFYDSKGMVTKTEAALDTSHNSLALPPG